MKCCSNILIIIFFFFGECQCVISATAFTTTDNIRKLFKILSAAMISIRLTEDIFTRGGRKNASKVFVSTPSNDNSIIKFLSTWPQDPSQIKGKSPSPDLGPHPGCLGGLTLRKYN